MDEELDKLRNAYYQSGVNTTVKELRKIHVDTKPRKIEELMSEKVSGDEKRFLDLVKKESLSVSETYKKLGLSARKGNKIKEQLIEKKLIVVKEERNGKGWKKLLMPSEERSVAA